MEYILFGLILIAMTWGLFSFIRSSKEDMKLEKQIEVFKFLNKKIETSHSSVAFYDNKAYLYDGEKVISVFDLNK
jgi:hypothetical protein